MQINTLKLLNFRNYETLDIKFSPSVNIIYGNNGAGKTNLVEAIYMLGFTRTFRFGRENVVIKEGKNIAKVEALIKTDILNCHKLIISDEGKKIKVNNNAIFRLSDYISCVNIVLFNPDDLKIIKDAPMTRRKILNIEIANTSKEYVLYLNKYNKLLKQRNSFLKKLNINNQNQLNYLRILTEQLVNIGIKIVAIRKEFICNINGYLSEIYWQITNKKTLVIKYKSDFLNKSCEELIEMYEKIISREIILGKTLLGINHDDIEFCLNNMSAREYLSVGEQKNCVIAFKLAEIQNIIGKLNKTPILILDDLFSELDQEKIDNILKLINKDIQIFITTTNIDKFDKNILSNAKIFKCIDGLIKEE